MSRERDQMDFPPDDVDTICSFRQKSKCSGGSVWKSVAYASFTFKKMRQTQSISESYTYYIKYPSVEILQ